MEVKILRKTLKEVSSYKTSYIVTPSINPEGIVEVEAIFSDLDDRQKISDKCNKPKELESC